MTTPAAAPFLEAARTLRERVSEKPGPGREKAYCDAIVALMREDGLFAVSVSEKLGGAGLEVADIAAITHEVARQSSEAGLLYAMHMSQAYSLSTHAEGPWFDALQKRMLAEQLIFASGTSEKGPGGDILSSICETDIQPDGSLVVVKESPNISYINHADIILVTANHKPEGGRRKQVLIAADVERDKFEPQREVDFLGMRGMVNRPWKFTITTPPEAVFSADFGAIARQTMTPSIQIFWAALWSGIVWTALDKAKRFVTNEISPGSDIEPVAQYELTRLVDKHHMMNAMIQSAVAAYETRQEARDLGFGLSAQINRIKVNCSELAVEICMGALNLIGVRGYAMGGPYAVAPAIADILSGPVMVSNYRLAMNTAKIERFVDESLY